MPTENICILRALYLQGKIMSRRRRTRDPIYILEELGDLLGEMEYFVSAVIVEGPRDVEALRRLGFGGRVEICSRVNVSDADLVESLSEDAVSVVVLTDFDEEGRSLNKRLTSILERSGVKVEVGLRRELGRLMAALGIYTIEALDNAALM